MRWAVLCNGEQGRVGEARARVYGWASSGALVWYWQNADGFWMQLWAVVGRSWWPAFVVYDLLQHMSRRDERPAPGGPVAGRRPESGRDGLGGSPARPRSGPARSPRRPCAR